MFDAPFTTYQRSRGRAHVVLGPDGGLTDLFQKGCAKAMVPRTHGPMPEVVFLNTSGGLTGGDKVELGLELAAGCTASAATQTAERAYASPDGVAEMRVTLNVGDGATLVWLPQETILFDHAALHRETRVTVGVNARFIGVETVVIGRAAMGETVSELDFRDARLVFARNGAPRQAELFALGKTALRDRAHPAGLAGNTVFATLTFIAPEAEDHLERLRRLLPESGVTLAASAWDERLVLRAMGDDSWNIRRTLLPAIRYLTGGHIPRVWQV